MATTQTVFGWPLPTAPDTPDVPRDMGALANGVAADLGRQPVSLPGATSNNWDSAQSRATRVGSLVVLNLAFERTGLTMNADQDYMVHTLSSEWRPLFVVYSAANVNSNYDAGGRIKIEPSGQITSRFAISGAAGVLITSSIVYATPVP